MKFIKIENNIHNLNTLKNIIFLTEKGCEKITFDDGEVYYLQTQEDLAEDIKYFILNNGKILDLDLAKYKEKCEPDPAFDQFRP